MPDPLVHLLATAGPQLHALLTRLTLRADRAEELMQDLFLKLHRSPGFAKAADPRAYAFRAAIHMALDARRQNRFFDPLPAALAAREAPPMDSAIQTEQAHRLMAAIAQLSAQAREAVVLHFIQQHSYEDAAAIMEKSAHQVRGLCADGLRQLRAMFHVATVREISHE